MGCSIKILLYLSHQKTPLNCPQQVSQLQSPSLLLDPWSLLSVGESVNKSAITSLSHSLCVCLSLHHHLPDLLSSPFPHPSFTWLHISSLAYLNVTPDITRYSNLLHLVSLSLIHLQFLLWSLPSTLYFFLYGVFLLFLLNQLLSIYPPVLAKYFFLHELFNNVAS